MSDTTLPGQRTPSPVCAANIKSFEQCRLVGYLPTTHDVPTIGWGATGRAIFVGLRWTQEQADARFDSDLATFGHAVDHLLGGASTTQGQFDAMVSLAYNIGAGNFAGSSLLACHRAGDFLGAARQFLVWDHQNHVVLPGLEVRRLREQAMYRA